VRRVTVVTAGHLATCPRMVKAADALQEAGYSVRVISTQSTPWAIGVDRELHARRSWRWEAIDYTRSGAPSRWFMTGVRSKIARRLARRGGRQPSFAVTVHALSRVHSELLTAILRERQDMIYGGTVGAIGAVAEASCITGVPCGIDFEDFHCGEHPAVGDGERHNTLATHVMLRAIGHASFVTAGSAAIARACEERFGIRPLTIDNVFRLPSPPSLAPRIGALRLYWFGQTIGPYRGLEDVIRGVGQAAVPAELHLRGLSAPSYSAGLQRLVSAKAPQLKLVLHPPDDADAMVTSCRSFDVGVACESTEIPNRSLSLSNKALTYPLAGLALVVTDTPGQRPLAADLGEHAIVYRSGDIDRLADGLSRWATNRRALRHAQLAAWEAARRRWHWEHPLERDALLAAVRTAS
jgi:hypothetical protein